MYKLAILTVIVCFLAGCGGFTNTNPSEAYVTGKQVGSAYTMLYAQKMIDNPSQVDSLAMELKGIIHRDDFNRKP